MLEGRGAVEVEDVSRRLPDYQKRGVAGNEERKLLPVWAPGEYSVPCVSRNVYIPNPFCF